LNVFFTRAEHRTFNIERPTLNEDRQDACATLGAGTPNIEHPTSNAEHPTSNIEHRTSNIEHPTSNIQHPMMRMIPQTPDARMSAGSNEWCFFGKKGEGFRARVI
jgi:hypothetical protein